MSEPSPKVTVFIPVYNREAYIGAAIRSVLAQTFTDFELLVIDDGSTDASREVVRGFADPRLRLVCNPRNLGIPKTRNLGLSLARGRYIALLDSDDCAHPERLARQVAFLDAHPDYAEIGSFGRAIDASGRPLARVRRQPVAPADVEAELLFRCCLSNRSIMGRTALLRAHGYREDFVRCQDYDLHVRLARWHKLGNLPEVLVYGRVHPGQITRQTAEIGTTLKCRIAADQLAELGVAFDQEDVARHVLLARTRKTAFMPDAAYLAWAETWLRALLCANQTSRRYDAAALGRTVGATWWKICAAGAPRLGWHAWQTFLRSPLALRAGADLGRRVAVLSRPNPDWARAAG